MTSEQLEAAAIAVDRIIPYAPAVNYGPSVLFEDGEIVQLISLEAARAALKAAESQ